MEQLQEQIERMGQLAKQVELFESNALFASTNYVIAAVPALIVWAATLFILRELGLLESCDYLMPHQLLHFSIAAILVAMVAGVARSAKGRPTKRYLLVFAGTILAVGAYMPEWNASQYTKAFTMLGLWILLLLNIVSFHGPDFGPNVVRVLCWSIAAAATFFLLTHSVWLAIDLLLSSSNDLDQRPFLDKLTEFNRLETTNGMFRTGAFFCNYLAVSLIAQRPINVFQRSGLG